jgi:hypothetical protein
MIDVTRFRREFWGDIGVPFPRHKRKEKLYELLSSRYHRDRQKFDFTVFKKTVCERAFLIILGELL